MSTTIIQKTPAYELSVALDTIREGHYLRLLSHIPIARHPEHQVRFQAVLSTEELSALHAAIGRVLREDAGALAGGSIGA